MKSYYLQFGSGDPRTFAGLNATFLSFKLTDGTNVTPPGITEVPTSTGLYYFNWGTTTSISFLADAATTSPGTSGRYIAGGLDPADRADEFGTTLVAIGTSLSTGQTNIGATLVAIGNTSIAYGGTISAVQVLLGSTLIGIGNTSIAIGTTNVAIGTSMVALGTSIYALEIATGATQVAIGNSLNALGLTAIAIGTTNQSYLGAIGSTASLIGDSSTDPVNLFGYLKRALEFGEGRQQFVKSSGVLTSYDRTGATTLSTRTVANNSSLVIKS